MVDSITLSCAGYKGATLARYEQLLRPGGRIFLDACAAPRRSFRSFIRKHIWPGNATPLVLHE